MNEYDSELIGILFEEAGYVRVDDINEAGVIIFNTCSVREHAEARVWGQAGMLMKTSHQSPVTSHRKKIDAGDKQEKSQSPISNLRSPIIAIVGCMAQNYKDKIFQKMPIADIVCGTGNIYDLPQLVSDARESNKKLLAVDGNQRPHFIGPRGARKNKLKAFVTITEGCDNFCSYCIVPYVRSRQASRLPDDILEEAKYLADSGIKEITLLGQNVNSYGRDLDGGKINFIKLLDEVSKIKSLARIRFITNHPKDTSEELFKLMAENKKICPHLHLPLQSGSERILKAMNRKYTINQYLEVVDLYRKFVGDAGLTTDIIVGFPGETEEDFKATVSAMERIAYDGAFIFKYSPRPPAPSSMLPDDVPQEVKKERNQILLDLQRKISLNINKFYIGREVEVLVEGYDKAKKNLTGRTPSNKMVVFPSRNAAGENTGKPSATESYGAESVELGKVFKVKIKEAKENTLIAGE